MKFKSPTVLNRKWFALLSIPLVLMLSGCVKLDMALTVNKDKTMSGNVIFGLADSLAALGDSTGTSSDGGMDSLINKKAKGVTVSKYHEGGFTGEKVTFDHAPLSAFSSAAQKDGSFAIDVKGNKASISGVFDLSSATSDSFATSSMDSAFASAMMAGAQMRISVTFPGKITKSTGEISKDGRTVTWHPVLGAKTDLATDVTLDSPLGWIPWVIGAFLLPSLIVGLVMLNRKKRPITDLATESQVSSADAATNEGEGLGSVIE